VRVIPNHACVVTNLFDTVNLAEGDTVVDQLPILAAEKCSRWQASLLIPPGGRPAGRKR
jgi:hypothetical protein